MSRCFTENLASLPGVEDLDGIELIGSNGAKVMIENKPGSQGSLRLYRHLLAKYGLIDIFAAAEGLSLYAEHTSDAQAHPGKHPNIDRLLEIQAGSGAYRASLLLQQNQHQ